MDVDSKGDAGESNPYKDKSSELHHAYSSGFYEGYTNARAT